MWQRMINFKLLCFKQEYMIRYQRYEKQKDKKVLRSVEALSANKAWALTKKRCKGRKKYKYRYVQSKTNNYKHAWQIYEQTNWIFLKIKWNITCLVKGKYALGPWWTT